MDNKIKYYEDIKQAAYVDELSKIAKLTDHEKEQNRRVKRAIANQSIYPTMATTAAGLAAPLLFKKDPGYMPNTSFGATSDIDATDSLISNIRANQIDEQIRERAKKNKEFHYGFKSYINKLEKTPFGQDVKPTIVDKIRDSRLVSTSSQFLKQQGKDLVNRPFSNKHFYLSLAAGIVAGKVYRDVMNARYRNIKNKQSK